ncbi:oligosaccharide flippase family protein [Candidatus Sumerlaeota bacterium]|nr:oligosaccharide flippase family protein [Candidatus Sumerlaeota bacterium]
MVNTPSSPNPHGVPLTFELARNALFGGGARLITLAVGLVLTPYLLARLGAERFGVWALLTFVTGLIGLLDFSFRTSFVKYLAETHARDDREGERAILGTGLIAYGLFALGLAPILFFASDPLLALLAVPVGLRPAARACYLIGAAGYLLSNVLAVFPAWCDSRQRMDLTNATGVAALFVSAGATVGLVESGLGLVGAALGQFLGIALFHVACIPICQRRFGPLGLSVGSIRGVWFRRLFLFGFKLHVSSMCWIVNRQFDKFLLARWAGLPLVGSYELALRIAGNAGTLQPSLAAALVPASSRLTAEDDLARLRRLYREATRYLCLAGIPPFALIMAFHRDAMIAWIGRPDAWASAFLILLAVGYMVNSLSNGMAFVCQGIERPGLQAEQSALQLVANVLLSVILFRYMGPCGAALGTTLALVFGAAYFAWRFHPHIGVSTRTLFREAAWIPLVASASGALVARLAVGWIAADSRMPAILKLAAGLVVFAVVFGAICVATGCVGRTEWERVRLLLRRGKH